MKIMHKYCYVLLLLNFTQAYCSSQNNDVTIKLNKDLVLAVGKGASDEVQKLIQAGADINQTITYAQSQYDDYDIQVSCTLLEYAAKNNNLAIIKELIQAKATLETINKALIIAVEKGNVEAAKELIDASQTKTWTEWWLYSKARTETLNNALLILAPVAIYDKYLALIEYLIQAGAQIDCTNQFGRTGLMLLSSSSSYTYTEPQKKNRETLIQIFLKTSSCLNHADKSGKTALMIAIQQHDLDAVQILLQTPGINVNLADNEGNTALIIALNSIQTSYISGNARQYRHCMDSQKIIKILLEVPGINPHHVNNKGVSATKLINEHNKRAW